MVTNKLTVRYEEDFNLWTEQIIELLRSQRFEELDSDNLKVKVEVL